MDFIKKYWQYLVAGVVGIFGFFAWEKAKSAESLLLNQTTKEALLKKDQEINKEKAIMDVEAEKRNAIEATAEKEKKDVSTDVLLDFFNRK